MGKTGPEMWTDSLYSWLANCSENSCNIFPCSHEETADDLPQDKSMWVVGSGQVTMMSQPIDYNTWFHQEFGKYSLLVKSFWMQCPTFFACPSQAASSKPPPHRAEWAWVKSWQRICGVSTNINQFPRYLLGIPQSIEAWCEIRAVSADLTGRGLKTVLTLVQSRVPLLLTLVTKRLKCGGSMTSLPGLTTEWNWWQNLGKPLLFSAEYTWKVHK